MTVFVACLSSGKGTWGHVARLLQEPWDKAIVFTNDFGKEHFTPPENVEVVLIDTKMGIENLVKEYAAALQHKLRGDVAVNFVSGSGKEHMALLAALLKLGVGIRLVALTKDGMKEL